jgi:uncharacterized protein YjbI with pentapeptide repeats
MEVHCLTPCAILALPWQVNPGEFRMTFVVKTTYNPLPGGTACLSAEQLRPSGDETYDDDKEGAGSLLRASDAAFFKPRADVLLVGSAHAPRGLPVPLLRVSLRVGAMSKVIGVLGRRRADGQWGVRFGMPDPEPFARMPLRYENAFGGPGDPCNPVGKGRDGMEFPNLEFPGKLIKDLSAKHEPACFGPLRPDWSPRRDAVGTYKGDWFEKRWPCYPADFDWGWFNAAPRDQQVDGYLKGDEMVVMENLHPEVPVCECRLPGVRTRIFMDVRSLSDADSTGFVEVPANLDTLWIDTDRQQLCLVWRGVADIRSEEGDEIMNLVIVSEPLAAPPATVDEIHLRFREYLERGDPDEEEFELMLLDDSEPELEFDPDAEEAKAVEAMRNELRKAGLDPDKVLAEGRENDLELLSSLMKKYDLDVAIHYPLTRDEVVRMLAAGESFAGRNLSGTDLSGLHFEGVDFQEANLMGALLEDAWLTDADLRDASMSELRATGSRWTKVNLEGADLTGADLTNAAFTEVSLAGTLAEHATCRNARFHECRARQAVFAESDFAGARFVQCELPAADFSEAILEGALIEHCDLSEASLGGVRGAGVHMTATIVTKLRAAEKARFRNAVFDRCTGSGTDWEEADLTEARFVCCDLEDANFEKCTMVRANLDAADLKNANLKKAVLVEASLRAANLFLAGMQGADLSRADFRGANLYGVDLLDATIQQTHFEGANLQRTTLAK